MKSEYDTISSMSIEERTERYTIRRSAELRGQREPCWMDEDTEKYIARRIAELRGRQFCGDYQEGNFGGAPISAFKILNALNIIIILGSAKTRGDIGGIARKAYKELDSTATYAILRTWRKNELTLSHWRCG